MRLPRVLTCRYSIRGRPFFFTPYFSYNKTLAFADVMLEYVVERLYFLVPDVTEMVGALAPQLQVCLKDTSQIHILGVHISIILLSWIVELSCVPNKDDLPLCFRDWM